MNAFEELAAAKKSETAAQNKVIAALAKVEAVKTNLLRGLPVGANRSVAAGILPSGKVAIVIKTDDSKANRLEILDAVQLDEAGNIRTVIK